MCPAVVAGGMGGWWNPIAWTAGPPAGAQAAQAALAG
jgi:hypothetical protein